MSTPRHPATGRYVPPASAGLPDGDAVNQELQSKPDAPDESACAVPSGLPDHDAAMSTGNEAYMDLPPGPDAGSKNTGGDDAGFPS